MHEFQFYERERLEELFQTEQQLFERRQTQLVIIKELRARVLRSSASASPPSDGGGAADSASAAEEADKLEKEVGAQIAWHSII